SIVGASLRGRARWGQAASLTYLPPLSPWRLVANYVVPQTYSVNKPKSVFWPDVTQVETHRRWSGLGKPVVRGLAAYKLNHHGGLLAAGRCRKQSPRTEDLRVNEVA